MSGITSSNADNNADNNASADFETPYLNPFSYLNLSSCTLNTTGRLPKDSTQMVSRL